MSEVSAPEEEKSESQESTEELSPKEESINLDGGDSTNEKLTDEVSDRTYANTVSSPNSPDENVNDFDLEDSIKFINSEINDSNNDTSIVLTLSPSPIPRKVKRSFFKDITQNTFMGMLIFNF